MSLRAVFVSLMSAAILSACSDSGPLPIGGAGGLAFGAGGFAVGGFGGSAGGAGSPGGAGAGGATSCTCSLPNAQAACADAGCALVRCQPGFRNLDGDPTNGCEASCQPLNVLANGSLDFDLNVLTLSGKLTQNRQRLSVPRGTLRFTLAGSKPVDVALEAAGDALYTAKLFAGQYQVSYVKDGVALPLKAMAITASGALDFDLAGDGTPIVITGALTANGAALGVRGAGQPRATVRFVPAVGAPVAASVAATGAASYSITLASGTYDVVVSGDMSCEAANAVVPCHESVRKKALTLTTSGSLDLDLPLVAVSGAVTVNGAAMPSATSDRGTLKLVGTGGEGHALSLGTTGAARWSTLVYSGEYDFVFSRATCSGMGGLPCQTFIAKKQVPLVATGAFDVDLKVFDVSGQVLANGQALKNSSRSQSRGAVTFKPGPSLLLSATGAASYQARVYAGTYDIELSNATDCIGGALPCGSRIVKTLTVSAPGVFDVDVQVAQVAGTLTVNNVAMSNSPSGTSRGTVAIGTTRFDLPPTGPAMFEMALYPGTYPVTFNNEADCMQGPAPCLERLLAANYLVVGSDARLQFDLPVLEAVGVVTHNGQMVTNSTTLRGELLFRDVAGHTVVARLGVTGPAQYRARLFAGTYELLFRNNTDCPANGTSPLPCQGEVQIAPAVEWTVTGARDFDLTSVTLAGAVTVNRAVMAGRMANVSRGELRFGAFGARSTPPAVCRFTSNGPATYQLRLIRGPYDVSIDNAQDCGRDGVLPCQTQLLVGCTTP